MLHQRGLTAARILARPQISLRQTIARRYASHGAMEKQLSGPADNAFNRERLAVKAHAEATAGTSTLATLVTSPASLAVTPRPRTSS